MKELSAALKAKGLLLTIPVASSAKIIDKAYDIPTLSRYLDYVSVTSYNYHNHFDNVTGHVAPIKDHPDDVDKTLNVVSYSTQIFEFFECEKTLILHCLFTFNLFYFNIKPCRKLTL